MATASVSVVANGSKSFEQTTVSATDKVSAKEDYSSGGEGKPVSQITSSGLNPSNIKRTRMNSDDKEVSSVVAPFAESNNNTTSSKLMLSPMSPSVDDMPENAEEPLGGLRTDSKFNSSSDLAGLCDNPSQRRSSVCTAAIEKPVPVENKRQSQKFHVKWALSTEQGFKRGATGGKVPIHKEMEDVSWPTAKAMLPLRKAVVTTDDAMQAQVIEIHPESGLAIQVFVLADGHGGSEAPHFLVPRMRSAIVDVMCSKDWAFENEDEREAFEGLVINVFEVLDKEYCQNRIDLFKEWIEEFQRDPNKRPCDDGCTMVVNVLYRDWLVNCNVGDSRTILGSQLCAAATSPGKERPWEVDFTSVDHNISHPVKVYEIHENGGYFVYPGSSLQYFTGIVHPELRNWLPYRETTNLRLYRPLTESVQSVGLSNRRTLNLTATMGDLLFKLEPTILTPRPDVTFIRLSPNRNYSLVIASDGLWDHLNCQTGVHQQNSLVMGYVSQVLGSQRDAKHKPSSRKSSTGSASIYQAFKSPVLSDSEGRSTVDEVSDSESEPESDSDYEPFQSASHHHHRDAIKSVAPTSPITVKVAAAAVPVVSPNEEHDSSATKGPSLKTLRRLVQRLVKRERNVSSLFAGEQPRYDDVTVFVVSVIPEPRSSSL